MPKSKENISIAVVRRLPRYYRYLGELLSSGTAKISSEELSRRMGLTASQIRQDLNCFGGFGQQGYGYNVELLHNELGEILGLRTDHRVVLVGAGHLGHALANWMLGRKVGFNLIGAFDIAPHIVGNKIHDDVEVRHIDELEDFCKAEKPDVAVLTLPRREALNMAQKLKELGVKGFWNFSNMDLNIVGLGLPVENVHLSDSLMMLGYRLHESERAKQTEKQTAKVKTEGE